MSCTTTQTDVVQHRSGVVVSEGNVYVENGRAYCNYRKGMYMYPVDEVSHFTMCELMTPKSHASL